MSDAPQRRRVAMPAPNEWPRVGKIRLGEKKATNKTNGAGETIMRPSAIDYFRVDGEDGITSPESARSFHEVFGDQPTSIRCQLPGRTPEDVFEGAWRLYGAGKLKRRCDGTECDERTATGGWATVPCVCKAQGIPLKKANGQANGDHCKLSWTFNVLLPDVAGVGVWQIDTGSEISINRIARWLQMMSAVAGDLMLLEFTLNLVTADVAPDGRAKKVYVLEPRAVDATPRAMLGGGGRAAPPAIEAGGESPILPAPADDEEPGEEGEEGEVVLPTWEEVLDQLRAIRPDLSNEEIGRECSRIMGRTVNATELGDGAISGRIIGAFLDAAEALRGEQGDPGPEGQESFLPPDPDPDANPYHREPE